MKLAQVRRKLERVDRVVEKAISKGELPGVVVRAEYGDALQFERAYGAAVLSPERHEARLDTLYDLASLTKVIATTSSVLLLVSDGKLHLDRPVAEFLPAFAERDKSEITVRHLLTHSSGLRPWRAYYMDLREREIRRGETLLGTEDARQSIVQRILRSAAVHDPGEAAVYGDLGFIVLGALVEQVGGERLDAFCRRRIFEPLGMSDTHFNPVPFEGARGRYAATEQCEWRDKVVWGEVHDPNAWAMGGVAGHAGLFGSAADVLRFGQEMLSASRGESEVFPQPLAQEFFQRQDLPPGSDWALGWDTPTAGQSTSGQYFSEHSIGHTGFTGTSLWIDLERGAVFVVLANRVHLLAKKSGFALRPLLHDLIWEAFLAA
ncbi:MAG: beta-lactamase family protein [Deltaproteobacteria bacterium]|nr:beta-lactamase family protein [Deltaproteobacteria bacterium]MBW2413141.1 beta-lactamase family protein [Deltaproteobacteria bacterium]